MSMESTAADDLTATTAEPQPDAVKNRPTAQYPHHHQDPRP